MEQKHLDPIQWNFLDREAEALVTYRSRPHWDQPSALSFVTFRLVDSMPLSVIERWRREQKEWLAKNGFSDLEPEELQHLSDIPDNIRRQFQKFRKQRWHENLDDCHGSCVLGERRIAGLVAESILYFDGERYDIERFVIMPNHVHVLVQIRNGFELRQQCKGWLRYTARSINRTLGRSGELWQSEPFDHVIHSESQFRYLQRYILDNPERVRLSRGQFLIWQRDEAAERGDEEPGR